MKSKLLLALIAVFLALPLIPANGECNEDLGLRDTVRIGNVIVQDVVPGQLINVPIYVYSDEALVAMSFGFRWSGTNIRYANFTLAQEIVSLGFVRAPAYRSTLLRILWVSECTLSIRVIQFLQIRPVKVFTSVP